MALRIYEFRCRTCNRVEAHRVDESVHTARCKCGEESHRIISAVPSSLDPIKGHFPSATLKWAKDHEKAAKVGS
jgi:hypothetical protein